MNLRLGSLQSTLGRERTARTGPSARPSVALVKPRRRACKLHYVQVAVASQIEELGTVGQRHRRLWRDDLQRRELRLDVRVDITINHVGRAEVAFVEPAVSLFGEHAGQPFAVEVHPLILCAVDADGQICQALAALIAQFRLMVASL